MRAGLNEGKLPLAYFGSSADAVGFDVNLAHASADDLNVVV